MADVVKGLTHLAVNQALVSSSLIIRPIQIITLANTKVFFNFRVLLNRFNRYGEIIKEIPSGEEAYLLIEI